MTRKRIPLVLFEPQVGGHHGSYLGILLQHAPASVELQLVVSPRFLSQHADLVDLAKQRDAQVVTLSEADCRALDRTQRLRPPFSTAARPLVEWALLTRHAGRLGAAHAVAMYFDPLLQMCMPLRFPFPCPVSGIYFRPTFHYGEFADQPPISHAETRRAARQRLAISSALRHPAMGVLFSLDRLAVPALQALNPGSQVVGIPDPVEFVPPGPDDLRNLRSRLGIAEGRKIALVFGVLTPRKGLREALEAIQRLPKKYTCQLTLLIAGRMTPDAEVQVATMLESMLAADSHSVVRVHGPIPDGDVQRYFEIADFVVAAYQDHVGSSGIQIRAALAGKPLLGPRYGLMGELSRRHQLGPTVNSRSVSEISDALQRLLAGDALGVDSSKQAAFARQSEGQNFSSIFFGSLLSAGSERKDA